MMKSIQVQYYSMVPLLFRFSNAVCLFRRQKQILKMVSLNISHMVFQNRKDLLLHFTKDNILHS